MFRLAKIIIILAIATVSNIAIAESSRESGLRDFGDYMQVVNPVFVSGLSFCEKGFGHFATIYTQSFLTMHGIKFVSDKNKLYFSKRPYVNGKQDRYDGMPSGHTNSAWVAASYGRTFSKDYNYLSIPLYFTAAVTGYSRIHAKEHTVFQVIAGALLAEAITYLNSHLRWSNEYRYSSFYFGKGEVCASLELRF